MGTVIGTVLVAASLMGVTAEAADKVVKQHVMHINSGGRYEFPPGAAELHVKFLTVEEDATIFIGPDTRSAKIVVDEVSSFGTGSRIEIRGQDGSKAGQDGAKPASFVGELGELQNSGLTVHSKGGDGARGKKGSRGRDASRKRCTGGSGRPAGPGGHGGRGGAAGDGGDIHIEYSKSDQNSTVSLKVVSVPGEPGAGGPGGKGGAGAPPQDCVFYSRGGYGAGRDGDTGPEGEVGSEGRIEVVEVE